MTHAVDQILAAFVTTLVNAATSAGNNVFRGRVLPLDVADGELPAILVHMAEDTPLEHRKLANSKYLDSAVTIVTRAIVREDTTTLDNALLALRTAIHQALMATPTLGLGFVIYTWPTGAQNPDITAEGDFETGELPIVWIVQYRTNLTDPTQLT